jgi:hypothetical protein
MASDGLILWRTTKRTLSRNRKSVSGFTPCEIWLRPEPDAQCRRKKAGGNT